MIVLGRGDRIVSLTDTHHDAVSHVTSIVLDGFEPDSRDAPTKLLGQLAPTPTTGADLADVSATVTTRVTSPRI